MHAPDPLSTGCSRERFQAPRQRTTIVARESGFEGLLKEFPPGAEVALVIFDKRQVEMAAVQAFLRQLLRHVEVAGRDDDARLCRQGM
jgi:hypothetical protein